MSKAQYASFHAVFFIKVSIKIIDVVQKTQMFYTLNI